MSKSMLVTMPALLFLLDFWPLARVTRANRVRLIVEKIPVAALAIAAAGVTMIVQAPSQTLIDTTAFPPVMRIQNALVSYIAYLRDSFYFERLSIHYPLPRAIPDDVLGVSLALFLGITIGLALLAWRRPQMMPLMVGWLWFLVALFPTIGIVQSGTQARADRFTYFPAIGLAAGLVFAWPAVWLKEQALFYSRLVAAGAVVSLAVYMSLRLAVWRDPLVLYQDGIAHGGDSALIEHALGYQLQLEGNMDEALAAYLRALALEPRNPWIHNKAGLIRMAQGDFQNAVLHFQTADALQPNNSLLQENLRQAVAARAKASSRPSQER
jgi:hypothetical protein